MKILKIIQTLILFLGMMSSHSATIQWGGEIASDFYLSDGTQVSAATTPGIALTFELGAFDLGFDPSRDNMDQWRSNWRALDTANFSLINQYFSGEFVLSDSDSVASGIQYNGNSFSPGEDLYIWAYNQLSVDDNLEWVLMNGVSTSDTSATDPTNFNWELPDPNQSNQGTLPYEWRVSTANEAEFGGLASETGEGEISVRIIDDFQFATIPEPSASLCLVVFIMGILVKRRRS